METTDVRVDVELLAADLPLVQKYMETAGLEDMGVALANMVYDRIAELRNTSQVQGATVDKFGEYLNMLEASYKAAIAQIDLEEEGLKKTKNELPLRAFLRRQSLHERLRDLEVARPFLVQFAQSDA